MTPSASKLSLFYLLIFFLATPLLAQNSGTIQATVVDSAGAVIAGATVQAMDQAKGNVVRQTTTGADGLFVLQPLPSGVYRIIVRAKGMKELNRNDVHLDPYQKVDLGQLPTALGGTTELITVETSAPLVETATADHSSVIDSRQVTDASTAATSSHWCGLCPAWFRTILPTFGWRSTTQIRSTSMASAEAPTMSF